MADAAVVLLNPKTPVNVGGALRACAMFGVPTLRWTGSRVLDPADAAEIGKKSRVAGRAARLPREERLADPRVGWAHQEDAVESLVAQGMTAVCVEVMPDAEPLPDFVHPERAVYVFGPEDSSVDAATQAMCARSVTIPATGCLNLAASVNVVLYDRTAKVERAEGLALFHGMVAAAAHRGDVADTFWDAVSGRR
jgi:tRNA(Leu) C34 or U34 (ribose-2'-O)-methylase TrmL